MDGIQIKTPAAVLGTLNDVEAKNAPSNLYLRGDLTLLNRGPRISIVGSRKASPDGLKRATILARLLAQKDMIVVSGLAAGIDTAAHRAAIDSHGRTIAVIGTSLEEAFPPENAALQTEIADRHLLVSQFAPGTQIKLQNFPIRNRTMALLTDATVIVEAGEKSGTLHQGWEALRLGRLLFLMENVANDARLSCAQGNDSLRRTSVVAVELRGFAGRDPRGDLAGWNGTRCVLLIERLPFAATYIYSPRGEGAIAVNSRTLRDRVKAGDDEWIQRYSTRVHELAVHHGVYPGFFGKDTVLVPVPGSSPLVPGALWAPERLALELAAQGLASIVWSGIRRVFAVPKSAFAAPGARPTVQQHFDSFEAVASLAAPARIVLVDDVMTKGRTLLAAASRLQERFPDADIRGFALVRTMGLVGGIEQLLDPCVGEIRWEGEDAHREP